MLPKPDGCRGCLYYGDGQGFVPDELVEGAPVYVCGQGPGDEEEASGKVFVGATGQAMERAYFPLAGLERGAVSIGNALRCRLNHKNALPELAKDPGVRAAIEHCTRAHRRIPEGTRLIVAQGDYALWSLTGEGVGKDRTIGSWRGYVLPYCPPPTPRVVVADIWTPVPRDLVVLATYHLAYLFHAPWDSPVARSDWAKVLRVLAGTWPARLPRIESVPPAAWPHRSALDTEFDPLGRLTRYSQAWHDRTGDRLVVVEAEGVQRVATPGRPTIIFQNAEADLPYVPFLFVGAYETEDTMLKHAALFPDLDHDLNFLGSLHAPINRWKHLAHANPRVYAGGDAWGTLHVNNALSPLLERDPRVRDTYYQRMLPLWPIIVKARQKGIRVNHAQAAEILKEFDKEQFDAVIRAQAAVGWPINVGAPAQVAHWLYDVEKKR